MVRLSRKNLRRPKRKSYRKTNKVRRSYRKMLGGAFTQQQTQQLLSLGFTENDIQILSNTGIGFNIIQLSLNQINPNTGAPFTPQELIQSINETNDEMNELDISGISTASDDEHDLDNSMDISFDGDMNDSFNTTTESVSGLDNNYSLNNTMNSLHESDLGISSNNSVNTTRDDSFGGRKRKTYGKTKKGRKARKYNRKSRKQRGGMCFGNGVGANSSDPNYSIYNTNMLKLFPYRP